MRIITTISIFVVAFAANAQTIDANSTNKKKAIKMEFFSPLTGNTTIGYESYIKDWLSWEGKVGIIGLGTDNSDTNPSGVLLKAGPKFKLNPDFVTNDLRGSHLLGGKYIRPEIAFAYYNEDVVSFDGNSETKSRQDYTSVAFLITYGRQYILANIMTLDYHIGLGYGYDSSEEGKYNFGYSNGNNSFPVAISVGFTIGVLLK